MDTSMQAMGDVALSQLMTTPLANKGAVPSNIDKAAQDFESVFITQMLQPMFDGIAVDPIFGGGHGEEIMRSFMVQEYGKIIAKNGGFGLASAVKAELIRTQQNAKGGRYATNQ